MRKLIVSTFITLDGVMQAPGGPEEDPSGGFTYGGWSFNYWDDMMGQVMGESMSKPFELLLGRKTYEIFAAHWPHNTTLPSTRLFRLWVECETQEEIDYYWEKFSTDGRQESMCGWLKDKFGVSWQVSPIILGEMLRDPDKEKVDRVTNTCSLK